MFDIEEGKKKMAFHIMIGAAIGASVGIMLGVLFAPRAGKETREKMGAWIRQRRQRGAELLAQLKAEAKHKKEQVAAVLEASRHAYEETAHR